MKEFGPHLQERSVHVCKSHIAVDRRMSQSASKQHQVCMISLIVTKPFNKVLNLSGKCHKDID